ncbi:MAG: MBL fold metallo-hydrolase [Campylobacterota bacterium]|nr:MBL fold metallo-hydrolase [Campylobacterota bacterium]
MIKKIIGLFIVSSLSLFGFDYNLKPKKVSENVWCFFGALEMPTKENGGNMSNHCYIKGKSSYILLDSGPTYKYAQQAYEAMSKIEKLPVSVVLNTHEHDDHWMGNSFYKEKFNSKLIGVELQDLNYKEGDNTRMHKLLTHEAIDGTKIVKLDKYIKNEEIVTFDGEDFRFVPVGQGHSKFDVFMYMPKRKVLFAGDLVMNGRITSNRDGLVIGQLKALETISKYDFNVLVPGHGFDTTKNAIDESIHYFDLLKERVLSAVEEDVGLEGVTKFVKMVEFKDKAMFDILNSGNVLKAYSELEFYEEE